MIAARIERKGKASSFAKLGKYIVDARGQEDPRSWVHTAEYILDTRNAGEKVSGVRLTNCVSDNAADATLEILAVQAKNTRSKGDKSYHLVVSFPAGERPAAEVLRQIEDRLCAAIGFAEHQRISAVHTDTEFLHIHVAINKVHPGTLRNVEPWYDKKRLMETCEALELQFGLQRTNHGLELYPNTPQSAQTLVQSAEQLYAYVASNEREQGARAAMLAAYLDAIDEQPDEAYLQTIGHLANVPHLTPSPQDQENIYVDHYARAQNVLSDRLTALRQPYAEGLVSQSATEPEHRLRGLPGRRLAGVAEGAEMLLPGHASNRLDAQGDQRSYPLRWRSDGDRAAHRGGGESGSGRLSQRALRMEVFGGRDSLVSWVQREVRPALEAANDWQSLHRGLAAHGLTIKLRGAGLVIEARTGERIKASDVARQWSFQSLTAALGPFEPAEATHSSKPRRAYTASPKQPHASTTALFQVYQTERREAQTARKAAAARIRQDQLRAKKRLADRHALLRAVIQKGPFDGLARRLAYMALAATRRADWRAELAKTKTERNSVAQADPMPDWNTWLADRASAGDASALAVLRSRPNAAERHLANWLRAHVKGQTTTLASGQLRPRVDKAGTAHYRLAGGDTVKDSLTGVRVDGPSDEAALLGLAVAMAKYAGQDIIIDGTKGFREQVARLAGANGINVRFADAATEALRESSTPPKPAPRPVPPPEPIDTAVAELVTNRNSQRLNRSTIVYHRTWQTLDAGEAMYQGRRSLSDGGVALLLERNTTMLVKRVTTAEAERMRRLAVGSIVRVSASGDIEPVLQNRSGELPTRKPTHER